MIDQNKIAAELLEDAFCRKYGILTLKEQRVKAAIVSPLKSDVSNMWPFQSGRRDNQEKY